jgi:hypothetical protein
MDMPDLIIPWKALQMTLAIIPGICFVTWTGHTGWMRRKAEVNDLTEIYKDIRNAKREGLWEFAQNFLPICPVVAYAILIIILFLIPYDTVFIAAFNASALPAGVISYHEGRKAGRWRHENQGWQDFDPSLFVVLKIIGVWILTAVVLLAILRIFGFWRPT